MRRPAARTRASTAWEIPALEALCDYQKRNHSFGTIFTGKKRWFLPTENHLHSSRTVLKTTTSLSVSRVFEDAEWCFVMYNATPAHARRADMTNYSIITRKGRSRKPRRHYSSCTIGNSRWADVKAPVETWAPKASILSEESFIL